MTEAMWPSEMKHCYPPTTLQGITT